MIIQINLLLFLLCESCQLVKEFARNMSVEWQESESLTTTYFRLLRFWLNWVRVKERYWFKEFCRLLEFLWDYCKKREEKRRHLIYESKEPMSLKAYLIIFTQKMFIAQTRVSLLHIAGLKSDRIFCIEGLYGKG